MDKAIAQYLCELNTQFYLDHASSFSETRQSAWPGWERLVEELYGCGALWADTLRQGTCAQERRLETRVLDVACGNLRFERFVESLLPDTSLSWYTLDNCMPLLGEGMENKQKGLVGAAAEQENLSCVPIIKGQHVHYERDIVSLLLDEKPVCYDIPPVDLAVSFGFMHHIPTFKARCRFMQEMVHSVAKGGFVGISFWRFADNESMQKKAVQTTKAALVDMPFLDGLLEEGDYLLGWQDSLHSYRYCHSFTTEEIDALVASLGSLSICQAARFRADGRSGALNEYLLLQGACSSY